MANQASGASGQQSGSTNYGGQSGSGAGPNMGGSGPGGGTQGGVMGGGAGGHSVSGSGPVQFSNLTLPISFPANKQEILQGLHTLSKQQREQWQDIINRLPADRTFQSLQELQQACEQLQPA